MKKETKIAWKRFVVLVVVLAMAFGVIAAIPSGLDSTGKIVVGSIILGIMAIYWIYAIIAIRRKDQLDKKNKELDKNKRK
jgi:hypothetical protein